MADRRRNSLGEREIEGGVGQRGRERGRGGEKWREGGMEREREGLREREGGGEQERESERRRMSGAPAVRRTRVCDYGGHGLPVARVSLRFETGGFTWKREIRRGCGFRDIGAAPISAAEPELQAELVDLVLHGAGGGQGLEVLGGAAHELGLELVDLAALPPLQGQLDGGALLSEDEVAQDGQRLADDLRRGNWGRGAPIRDWGASGWTAMRARGEKGAST
jgi:hypothetical protein